MSEETIKLVGILVAAVVSVLGFIQSRQNAKNIASTRVEIDGRLTQLLKVSNAAKFAEGVKQEKDLQEEKEKGEN